MKHIQPSIFNQRKMWENELATVGLNWRRMRAGDVGALLIAAGELVRPDYWRGISNPELQVLIFGERRKDHETSIRRALKRLSPIVVTMIHQEGRAKEYVIFLALARLRLATMKVEKLLNA